MELRHLRYFVAVAEEGSFTRAADRLWIAQPGLSQQILALERELGARLLDRGSRGAELTDAGRTFLERARITLRAADDALLTGQDAGAGLTGHLRLGLSWRSRYDIAPDLQFVFSRERPAVDVAVIEAQSDLLVTEVRDHRLDAAIVLGPQEQRRGLESLAIVHREVVVLLARDHPLAVHEVLGAEHLHDQLFMVSGDRGAASYDQQVRRILESLGVQHRVQRGGYGYAMLPPVRAGEALMLDGRPTLAGGDDIVARPLIPPQGFHFDVVWSSSAGRSAALDAFLEVCRRLAESETADGAASSRGTDHP